MMGKGNWDKIKHKTYDTSNGFGNESSWKDAFNDRLQSSTQVFSSSVLGNCTTLKQLVTEFRKLIKKHHPDKAGDNEENKMFTQKLIAEFNDLKKKFNRV